MWRKLRGFFQLLFFVFVMLRITGCGVDVSTVVSLNEDFSGSRTTTFYVPEDDKDSIFLDTIATVNSVIGQEYPQQFNPPVIKHENNCYTYIYTLEFSSLEEYEKKLSELTGKTETVSLKKLDSVFRNGYTYSESCYSYELFSWLPDLLVSNGCIESTYADYVLGGEYEESFLYQGEKSESWVDKKVEIDHTETCALNGVYFFTKMEDESIQRDVVIDIPDRSFDKRKEEILAYLNERVPLGATSEQISDQEWERQLFVIHIPACSWEEMSEAMKIVTDSENTSFTINPAYVENYTTLVAADEILNLDCFVSDDTHRVFSRYYVYKNENEISIEKRTKLAEEQLEPVVDSLYPEYQLYLADFDSEYEMMLCETRAYKPDSAQISMALKENQKANLEISVYFSEKICESDRNCMIQTLQSTYGDDILVAWDEENASIRFTISERIGRLEETIQKMLPDAEITYEQDTSILKPKQSYTLTCDVDLSGLLCGNVRGSVDSQFELPGTIKEVDWSMDFSSMEENLEKNSYFVKQGPARVNLKIEGKVNNSKAYLIWALILCGLALAGFLILFFRKKSGKKKTGKRRLSLDKKEMSH